jgi:cyclopropane-fatty-acyl-phospholipid synthase
MSSIAQRHSSEKDEVWVSEPGGRSNCYSDPEGRFAIVAAGSHEPGQYLKMDAYSAASAFIEGDFDVHGDMFAAIRYFSNQPHHGLRHFLFSMLAKTWHIRTRFFFGGSDASRSIRFHYDRSNEFYAQFLDSRMLYSAAHFEEPTNSLEQAQKQKLENICKDLVLRSGDRFLDIGCGWGGLVCYAAGEFGARSFGCTLSPRQFELARKAIERQKLKDTSAVELCDYRALDGRFDKIASVGMFEHVGRSRLPEYFEKIYAMLEPGGLFLNRGVVRRRRFSDGPDTRFLQKRVFPDGDLVHLDDVVREGERAGFAVAGVRDLRLHYALTCRRWVENLQAHAERARAFVGEAPYRTWLLYLAGSAVSFEDWHTGAAQVLFSKPR